MDAQAEAHTLTIDFSLRLPFVEQRRLLPPRFSDYGRLARLDDGSWLSLPLTNCPLFCTLETYRWALDEDTLFVSPETPAHYWQNRFTPSVMAWLLDQLALRQRYNVYQVRYDESREWG